MGDKGSLIVAIVISIPTIKFIEMNRVFTLDPFNKIGREPSIAIEICVIPLFDILRFFLILIFIGRSPISPDRNHCIIY